MVDPPQPGSIRYKRASMFLKLIHQGLTIDQAHDIVNVLIPVPASSEHN